MSGVLRAAHRGAFVDNPGIMRHDAVHYEYGAHRLYMGRKGSGLLQLISLGGLGVWQRADAVWLLLGCLNDAHGAHVRLWHRRFNR